jgi:site-specific DNA-methyltransferase (adenine-specific)
VDACRVEGAAQKPGGKVRGKRDWLSSDKDSVKTLVDAPEPHPDGRWPANIILDEEAGKILDKQSGMLTSGRLGQGHKRGLGVSSYGGGGGTIHREYGNDSGGASRFFYCAKTSKSERELGLEDQESKTVKDGRKAKADSPRLRGETERKNTHPTVKPISLMSWLVRLVTPQGGTILDPFTGSGSTGCAAVQEGFNFIGCELEEEYVNIARKRIEAIK